ncbi:MAG TPA: cupin domain-containing protein [Terracidiphilus sp.]|nr:cupin domain-containing protein [Terracidiphilus sp.]
MSDRLLFALGAVDAPSTHPEPGLERQVLVHTPELMLVRHRMQKGWRGTRHAHPHHQLVYIVSGGIRAVVRDTEIGARAGDSFIVEPNAEHQAWALEDSVVLDVFTPAREDYL